MEQRLKWEREARKAREQLAERLGRTPEERKLLSTPYYIDHLLDNVLFSHELTQMPMSTLPPKAREVLTKAQEKMVGMDPRELLDASVKVNHPGNWSSPGGPQISKSAKRPLIIGPGINVITSLLKDHDPKRRLVLMDINPNTAGMLKRFIDHYGIKNVEVVQGDIRKIPVKNVDYIQVSMVLHETPEKDRAQVMRELESSLSPPGKEKRGRIHIIDKTSHAPCEHEEKYSAVNTEDLKRQIKQAGLKITKRRADGHRIYITARRKGR